MLENALDWLIALARVCLVGTHVALFLNHSAAMLLFAVSVFWTFEEAAALAKQWCKAHRAKQGRS